MVRHLPACLIFFFLVFVNTVFAKSTLNENEVNSSSDEDKKSIKELPIWTQSAANSANYQSPGAPPLQPGFAIIGASPENTVEPGSFKDLAISATSFLDETGELQPGVAVDFKPYWVLGERSISLAEYRKSGSLNFFRRALARTSITSAIVEGNEESGVARRIGLGVYTDILDAADPRKDKLLDQCVSNAISDYRNSSTYINAVLEFSNPKSVSANLWKNIFWDLNINEVGKEYRKEVRWFEIISENISGFDLWVANDRLGARMLFDDLTLPHPPSDSGEIEEIGKENLRLISEAVANYLKETGQEVVVDEPEGWQAYAQRELSEPTLEFDKAVEKCRSEFDKRALISASWVVGFGAAFNDGQIMEASDGDVAGDMPDMEMVETPETETVWTGARIPLYWLNPSNWCSYDRRDDIRDRDSTALNFVGQYSNEALVAGPDDSQLLANRATVGVSITESRESFRLDIGASYNFTEFYENEFAGHDLDDEEFARYYLRAATPANFLGEGAWLEFGIGGVSNAAFEDEGFATLRLTYSGE